MIKKTVLAAAAAVISGGTLLMPQNLEACGPFFQPSYLENHAPYWLHIKDKELFQRMLKLCDDLIPARSKLPKGTFTEEAIRLDIAAGVKRYMPALSAAEQQKIVSAYNSFITDHRYRDGAIPVMPDELQEFKLYREGVAAVYTRGYNYELPEAWKKLLELPPEKRHFRTTWVYFMMGNITKDAKYYQACRDAARAGFADTAGLARASYINEFRYSVSKVKKLHIWAEALKNDPQLDLFDDEYLGRMWFLNINEKEFREMLADPLGREFMAVLGYCTRKPFDDLARQYKFRNADIIAFQFYRKGKTAETAEWLSHMEKPTLLSVYLEACLARIDGKLSLAAAKLHTWLEMVKNADPLEGRELVFRRGHEGDEPLELDVYGILGNTMVMRRDFVEAAEFFYRAEQMESDIATIAERYLSMDELVKFTEYVSKDAPYNGCSDVNPKVEIAQKVRHLTARRAFREGRMDIAQKYIPKELLPYLDMYLRNLAKSKDKNCSGDERALALYNAAKIMRFSGMDLCGTEIEPDNYRFNGDYYAHHEPNKCKKCKYDPVMGRWTLCSQQPGGFRSARPGVDGFNAVKDYSTVQWNQRWHYRYNACKMALAAGQMAQDKELKALIYYFGGEILRRQSPAEADVFYKRLVRECADTTLGRLADKEHWFPVDNLGSLRQEITSGKPCASLEAAKNLISQIK